MLETWRNMYPQNLGSHLFCWRGCFCRSGGRKARNGSPRGPQEGILKNQFCYTKCFPPLKEQNGAWGTFYVASKNAWDIRQNFATLQNREKPKLCSKVFLDQKSPTTTSHFGKPSFDTFNMNFGLKVDHIHPVDVLQSHT